MFEFHCYIYISGIAANDGTLVTVSGSFSQSTDGVSSLPQTSMSVRTQMLVARSASTTRGILNVNATKDMRSTLLLRPARQKVRRQA